MDNWQDEGDFKEVDVGELARRQHEPGGGITAAIENGNLFRESVLQRGTMLNSKDAAAKLGITRKALARLRNSRRLLGLKGAKPGFHYPKFQFDEAIFPIIEEVLKAMPGYDPWGIYLFLVQPEPLLYPDTPLQRLREGKLNDVVRAAMILNEELI